LIGSIVRSGVALVALAGCGSGTGAYPPHYEANFMRGCQARGAPAEFCACVWDKIEAEVPARDFAALDRMPAGERSNHPLTRQMAEYSQACRAF
jgi:hypothetical protein